MAAAPSIPVRYDAFAFFGDERFHAAIAEHAGKSGPELGRAIIEEMMRWSGHPARFEDDVTLVVVEVR
jgi:serine phosphatase RsbU (regulator of sigma subunit)